MKQNYILYKIQGYQNFELMSENWFTCASKVKTSFQPNSGAVAKEESISDDRGVNGEHKESKLELFGFDSLVNILGLKR